MPDMSGLGRLLFAALGGFAGALMIVPLAIGSIWLDGLMTWAWVPPVAGLVAGSVLGE